ncbi:Gag protease polyprotein [Gossypium australe]|uniref:Gag protease polyprotein n=1 Tax=Gossypium australe TaxID=47621 RepID=A0A5B6WRA9_9ROSI|nr:Gag protease polyprotein [Gossypium australe]
MKKEKKEWVMSISLWKRKKDSVWFILDRLAKAAHFLPVKTNYSLQKLAKLYISKILRLHGVPVSIISDKDPRFMSQFCKKLHEAFGAWLDFNIAFHPQTIGQSKRVIQIIEDMLRSSFIDFCGSWEEFLPLAGFAYNNNF